MNTGHAQLCSSPEWAQFLASDVLPTALADCDPGEDILEIGPGYGATTARLVDLGGNLTAVEIDPALAARLRERFPGVDVIDGRGEALPLPGSSFSTVFCFTMLHHVHTAAAQDSLFAEALRVLRPGGSFVGSDSIASPRLRDFHAGDIYTPVDPRSLPGRLGDAGFTDIKVHTAPDGGWFAFSAGTR